MPPSKILFKPNDYYRKYDYRPISILRNSSRTVTFFTDDLSFFNNFHHCQLPPPTRLCLPESFL